MKYTKLIIAFGFGGICLYLAFHSIDLHQTVEVLKGIDYFGFTLATLALFFASMTLRALRWGLLFEEQCAFSSLFSAQMGGYLINNIAPARAGEVFRAHMLGIKERMSRTQVFSTVIIERIADLMIASMLLFGGGLISSSLPVELRTAAAMLSLAATSALGGLIIIAALRQRRFLMQYWDWAVPAVLREKVFDLLYALSAGLLPLKDPGRLFRFMFLSCGIWAIELLYVGVICASVETLATFAQELSLLMFAVFGGLIPGPPAQAGVFEFAVSTGARVMSLENGLALAIAWHVSFLVYSSVVGFLCIGPNAKHIFRLTAYE